MRQIYKRLSQIALTNAAVLVSGESGTGKELVARTLHDLSPRRDGPFWELDCSSTAATSMESDLFGHENVLLKDDFKPRQGCFEQADGGTLFLDEITNMAPELQAKLLRVLEQGQFRRIGATESIPLAVRVVVATSGPPARSVKEGKIQRGSFLSLECLPPGASAPPRARRRYLNIGSILSGAIRRKAPTSDNALGS